MEEAENLCNITSGTNLHAMISKVFFTIVSLNLFDFKDNNKPALCETMYLPINNFVSFSGRRYQLLNFLSLEFHSSAIIISFTLIVIFRENMWCK